MDFVAEIVAKEMYDSEVCIEFESINCDELGLYLTLTVSEDELIEKCIRDYCHTRIHKMGRKPNITVPAGSSQERSNTIWNPPTPKRRS